MASARYRGALLLVSAALSLTAFANVRSIEEIPREVNGRRIDAFWQAGDVKRGETPEPTELVIVRDGKSKEVSQ